MIHALRELASIVFAAAADPSFVAPSTTTGIFAATGGGTELRLSSPSVCLSVCLRVILCVEPPLPANFEISKFARKLTEGEERSTGHRPLEAAEVNAATQKETRQSRQPACPASR